MKKLVITRPVLCLSILKYLPFSLFKSQEDQFTDLKCAAGNFFNYLT